MEGLNSSDLAARCVSLDDAAGEIWDLVIVGSGPGGATLGYALAASGMRVLFVERGLAPWSGADLLGRYPEEEMRGAMPDTGVVSRDLLRRAGRDWQPIEDISRSRARAFIPFIGAGAGGSSALYGMAMERFFPCDFETGARHRAAVDSSLPEAWPVSYSDFAPWYERAEALYRVRGARDPLRRAFESGPPLLEPAPLTPENEALTAALQRGGLHPYQLPMACEKVAGCAGCQGYLCARACKNDSARVCLAPALRDHGARWLGSTEAVRIAATGARVEGVVCRAVGENSGRLVRGRMVALAAGALRTPALLLRSTSADWPDGLANRNGHIGRYLMRHNVELLALDLGEPSDNRQKQVAFNDFYDHPELGKLGSVQSFGRLPPTPMLMASLRDDVGYAAGPIAAGALGLIAPLLRPTLNAVEARSLMLALIVEDLPYPDHRVEASLSDSAPLRLHYRLRPYEKQRVRTLLENVRRTFHKRKSRVLSQADNNQRIAHVCGTCRFGLSPVDSALDVDCKAHELDNLFVVDASFFPSSGATNPTLTIVANALRVAARIQGH